MVQQSDTICFLDFDNTLFDTRPRFFDAMRSAAQSFGVDPALWDETMAELKWEHIPYHPERHFVVVNQRLNNILSLNEVHKKFLENFQDLRPFLFTDVILFLEQLHSRNIPAYILSHGDPDWQYFKIQHAGIMSYFDKLLFTAHPGEKILLAQQHIAGTRRVIFIDDEVTELDAFKKKLPSAQTYLMRRHPAIPVPAGCTHSVIRQLLDLNF